MNDYRTRAKILRLHGLYEHWDDFKDEEVIKKFIDIEEEEQQKKSLKQRLSAAKVGAFKPMADYDWSWPKSINREQIEELFTFKFIEEKANVIIVGSNGVGKTMLLKNLAYQAVLKGYSSKVISASDMLNDLAAQEGAIGLKRRLKVYTRPQLLAIDELGYLRYGNNHADLLFEIVNRRYDSKPIIITTNKPFAQWNDVFPSSSSVVALVDRLVHRSEIIQIDADSFRLKESNERAKVKKTKHSPKKRVK